MPILFRKRKAGQNKSNSEKKSSKYGEICAVSNRFSTKKRKKKEDKRLNVLVYNIVQYAAGGWVEAGPMSKA